LLKTFLPVVLKTFFEDIISDKTIKHLFRVTLWFVPVLVSLFVMLTILHTNTQFIFYSVKLISVLPAIAVAYIILKKKLPFSGLLQMAYCAQLLAHALLFA
jgi:predicted membrane-bound dolichyl-phosphate-mannose-protein mannosyltransferase